MKYAFYPGCVSRGACPELYPSSVKVADKLGIELEEVGDGLRTIPEVRIHPPVDAWRRVGPRDVNSVDMVVFGALGGQVGHEKEAAEGRHYAVEG